MALEWLLLGGAVGAAATWALIGGAPRGGSFRGMTGACEDSFQRTRFADVSSTSMKAEIKAPYAKLVEAFGEPEKFDGGGGSFNEWQFKGPGGVYVIYDYNRDGSKGKKPYSWHVGAKVDDPELFLAWLGTRLRSKRLS